MRRALLVLVVGATACTHAQNAYNGEITLSPDGRVLAVSDCSETVRLFRVSDGRLVRAFTAPNENFPGLFVQPAFSPDGKYLTVGNLAPDGGLNPVWRVTTGRVVAELAVWADAFVPSAMSVVGFSGDGRYVLGSRFEFSGPQPLFAFQTSQWRLAFQSGHHSTREDNEPRIYAVSPKGTIVVSIRSVLDFWDPLLLTNNEWGPWWVAVPAGIEFSSFSGSGHVLMMAGDGWVAWHDNRHLPKEGPVQIGKLSQTAKVSAFVVRSLAASHNGKEAFIGARDGRIVRFDLASKKAIRTWKAFAKPVKGLAVSRDGSKLYATDLETIQIWNLRTGGLIRRFRR